MNFLDLIDVSCILASYNRCIYKSNSTRLFLDNPSNILCRIYNGYWQLFLRYFKNEQKCVSVTSQVIRSPFKINWICSWNVTYAPPPSNRHCEGITTAFKRTHIRINNSLDTIFSLPARLRARRDGSVMRGKSFSGEVRNLYAQLCKYIGILDPGLTYVLNCGPV